jgi:geranylgeranyl diphosphate synthase type II
MNPILKRYFDAKTKSVNRALRQLLPGGNSLIARAMRYSMFAGGKRLRPVLVIAGAELCGGRERDVMPAACALELVHTYSLIHDDLPAMDDDDLRRGMPTSHKKFGEACAILAGDALLTDAFRLMARCGHSGTAAPADIVKAVEVLAAEAGHNGMVGGQVCDTVEAGAWGVKNRTAAARRLRFIHLNKTAALIRASLLVGATLSGAASRQLKALASYGTNIGLAFQIADDVLDVTADKKLLGKRGSDRDNDKLTYVSLYGIDRARDMASELVRAAKDDLRFFGSKAAVLRLLADYIIERDH